MTWSASDQWFTKHFGFLTVWVIGLAFHQVDGIWWDVGCWSRDKIDIIMGKQEYAVPRGKNNMHMLHTEVANVGGHRSSFKTDAKCISHVSSHSYVDPISAWSLLFRASDDSPVHETVKFEETLNPLVMTNIAIEDNHFLRWFTH